jgi:DNA polymerase III subunit chi
MATRCQVDFYVLQDEAQSADLLACRLALMAWEQGNRSMILTCSDAECRRLDELMWEHPQGRFLPHALKQAGGIAPVMIGTLAELDGQVSDVLINMTATVVPEPGRFQRLLELVPANDAQRKASRDKFREYRACGLEPVTHQINRN